MESSGLKIFLNSVGNAVFSLNTVCVGLDGVASGKLIKSDTLTISWDPRNAREASAKARKFAVRAALVFVNEALKNYLSYVSKCSNQCGEVVIALNVDGLANKVINLSNSIKIEEKYYFPMVVLLIRWRNRVVHASNSPFEKYLRNILIEHAAQITKRHSNINIEESLKHFDSNEITLKDFTTLIAVTIRFVRCLDIVLTPTVETIDDLRIQIEDRNLFSAYKLVIGVNGETKRKKKFITFINVNFPSISKENIEEFYANRHKV